MTAKPGRNDPCPCGSGRKFKHCCGGVAAVEPAEHLAWRRIRRLLEENNEQLQRFAMNAYGPEALPEAWDEFASETLAETGFDFESRHIGIFMSWFHNFWSPNPNGPSEVRDKALHGIEPVRAYLARRGARLDPLMREYLESCLSEPLSFHEVVEVARGEGFTLRDLVTGREQRVAERSATEHMHSGDLVFGQVVHTGGLALLECCSSFAFPPIARIQIADACRKLVGRRKRSAFPLREYDIEMLDIYHAIAEPLLNPAIPTLTNTHGEPLSMRRVIFEIDSAERAFEALRGLDPASEAELAESAKRDADGRLVEAELHWIEAETLRRGRMQNTVLGTVRISGTRLTAEVNSEARERRLREIVDKALGPAARHRATEIQSVEKLLAEAHSNPSPSSPRRPPGEQALMDSPEVRAFMDDYMSRHYEAWVAERIPALGNKTPLQAMKTASGREAVEALVRQIERDGERMDPPLDAAITRRVRERLGLPVAPK